MQVIPCPHFATCPQGPGVNRWLALDRSEWDKGLQVFLVKQALKLTFSFPAATTQTTPERTTFSMAVFMASEKPPPRDMFMMALPFKFLLSASSMTNCRPARIPELAPLPWASRTLTAVMRAFFATPKVAPAMVPATWLPWPLSSSALADYIKRRWVG